MLKIPTKEFHERLVNIFMNQPVWPQYPNGRRSDTILCPSLDFLEDKWIGWWDRYRINRELRSFNGKSCDLIASVAVAEMNWSAGIKAEADGQDATAGIFVANVTIKKDLLDVPAGGHATCLIALTKDDKTWEPIFWEPQQYIGKKFTYEKLEKALERDACDVLDIFT